MRKNIVCRSHQWRNQWVNPWVKPPRSSRGGGLSCRKSRRALVCPGRRETLPVDQWNPWSATVNVLLRREAPRGRIVPTDRTSGANSGATRGQAIQASTWCPRCLPLRFARAVRA